MSVFQQFDWSKPIPFEKDWRAWSAVDELIFSDDLVKSKVNHQTLVVHDLFGVIGSIFNEKKPTNLISYASQKTYLSENWQKNKLTFEPISATPNENLDEVFNFGIIKIPKSLDLFEYYLNYIFYRSDKELEIVCGFMTKYFTPSFLTIAAKYFNSITQSKAHKKARLLYLKEKKSVAPSFKSLKSYVFKNKEYQNHKGIFSDQRIDKATELLTNHLPTPKNDDVVLDLACGNGIIGDQLLQKNPNIILHLLDDSFLALESAKLNVVGPSVYHHFSYRIDDIGVDTFDVVVCNPPFHIENYQTSAITLQLMRQVKKLLSKNGKAYLVVNIHLKYYAILKVIFNKVERITANDKYEILACSNI